MFGWDWPTLTLERLIDDWRELGYAEEVYEKIFHRNAEAFFQRRRRWATADMATAWANCLSAVAHANRPVGDFAHYGTGLTEWQTQRCRLVQKLHDVAGSERIPAADFIALLVTTFRHAGLSPDDAGIAAEVAAYGTLHGSDAHGAVQMPLYITGLLDGTIKSAPNVKTTNNLPCCMVMDADHALGLVVEPARDRRGHRSGQEVRPGRGRGAQQQPFRRRRLLLPSAPRSRA